MQQFKAQQAKSTAKLFADSINSAIFTQQKITEIRDSAHFATSGLFFTYKDRDKIQIPTKNFRDLVQLVAEGTKAIVLVQFLRDNLQKLQTGNVRTRRYQWHCEKIADSQIADLKQTFTQYCHEVNRLTLRTFLVSSGNFDETEKLMRSALKNIGVKDTGKYIAHVIRVAFRTLLETT